MIRGGRVTFHVSDLARAVRFYVETLGMKLVEQTPGAALFDAGEGFRLALVEGKGPAPGSVTLHAKVPLAEAIAIFENRGVAFETEATSGARFHDPDGNVLYLSA